MIVSESKGLRAAGQSFKGASHKKNDDRFIVKALDEEHLLLAVTDGMGGHPAGDIAAEDVVESLDLIAAYRDDKIQTILSAIDRADATIRDRVSRALSLEGMGATVTAVILSRRKIWWAHVGDSRLYLMRSHFMRQITKDHSFIQDFIDSGELSLEDARFHPMAHVLEQCVGCLDSGADCGSFDIISGDFILLSTDGLYRVVPDRQISRILSSSRDVSSSVDDLLALAAANGASDDTTVVVAHIYESD
jgi:protein phosphatase